MDGSTANLLRRFLQRAPDALTDEELLTLLLHAGTGAEEPRTLAARLLTCTCLSEGSVNSANVPMRKLMRAALSANASGVVLAHNHPAGIALPSHEDVELTRRLQQALDVVDILLLDHLVIADDDFVSLRDSGYLR